MRINKTVGVAIVSVLLIGGSIFYFNYNVDNNYVGSVGSTKLSKAEFQKHIDQTNAFYIYSKQDISKLSSLNKDTLESMINDTLVQNYAKEHSTSITDSEIKRRYDQVVMGFNRNNKIEGSNDEEFLARIKKMYGNDKNTYMDQLRMDILKEKVQAKVKMPLAKWLSEQKKSSRIIRK